MFKPVSSRVNFPQMEEGVLQFWKDEDIFRRTEREREGGPRFMLYEGPPTANGMPGIHHVLARVFKDIICRYKTMKGFQCLRKGGWDTHGLPVELEVERELGLTTKREIESYGIEEFNRRCRESVFRYVREWERMTERVAFWVDMDDPYVTLHNSYIETGWWIIKQLWDKGLVYQDMKGTPHCPRCVTSLSSHEVALGYEEDTPDPSVFIKFRLNGWDATRRAVDAFNNSHGRLTSHGDVHFLAWTTTPWTLPGNTALAVDTDAEYSLVLLESGERLVLASALLEAAVREPYTLLDTFAGRELVALSYEPLYDPHVYGMDISGFSERGLLERTSDFQPRVIAADFVSMEDGTGIVHIAPAFGDEDLGVGRQEQLNFVQNVDLLGNVIGTYPFAGKFVKEADEDIMADLADRGLLHRREIYRHTYPFCWRCNTPLLYYAKTSWYIRTTAVKDRLVSGNSEIHWNPAYIREGRFGEWLRNNVDWAVSRERYWGTPIPIWHCEGCGHDECIGSVAELAERSWKGAELDDLDLHRPYVDEITISCPRCNHTMHRSPEVLDAWFDSGAMPFSQWHVPHDATTEQLKLDGRLPADYICEAVDQTRGWFYSLHALSTLLTDDPCFRNVICLGLILDDKGHKMSKHTGNVVDPWSVIDAHGADATRWYLFTASQPGEPRRFSDSLVNEVVRRFLLTMWNVYSFFTTYASLDDFHPDQIPADWKPRAELDRWVLSELNVLVGEVTESFEEYDPTSGGRRIQEFVDRLSNWYVRRSRRRFWKSAADASGDQDKLDAYATLYRCLTTLGRLLAPYTPFVAEEMYQNLERSAYPDSAASVHLALFPEVNAELIDQPLVEHTRLAMRLASLGRSARAKSGIKVRQPLPQVVIGPWQSGDEGALQLIGPQLLDELNVKACDVSYGPSEMVQAARAQLGEQPEGVVSVEWPPANGEGADPARGDGTHIAVDAGPASWSFGIPQPTVEVRRYSVALDQAWMVAIDTTLTAELKDEGTAREVVHRIQNLRRSAGFELTDRITAFYGGEGLDEVRRVMNEYAPYIQQETLSDELVEGAAPEGTATEKLKLEGAEVVLAVQRV